MRIFKKSVYFLFESGSLDSPGGPSSNRRYSITGVLRRRVIMNFTSKGPAEAKSTITLRRIHLIRRPYAKRRGRRETMFDCPLSKTVKILDQRSCRNSFIRRFRQGKGKVGEDGDEKGKANAPSPQHSLHHSPGHCFACDFFLAEKECILATTGHGFQSAPRAHR